MKNSIFKNYGLGNLEALCAEVWPIVNDYLIDEIDSNSEILSASFQRNNILKCIEYICTEDTSAFFRKVRSLFSVIIRLYQTNEISTQQLERAFVDNEAILTKWFNLLIKHAEKSNFDDLNIKLFIGHLHSFCTRSIAAEIDPSKPKTVILNPFKLDLNSTTIELNISVLIEYNFYEPKDQRNGFLSLSILDHNEKVYSPRLTYSIYLPNTQIKPLGKLGIALFENKKRNSLGLLFKTRTVPFTKSNLHTVFPSLFPSESMESENHFVKSLKTLNSLNDKRLTQLLGSTVQNVVHLQSSHTPETFVKFIKNGDSFVDIRYQEPRKKKTKVISVKLNATIEALVHNNAIDVNSVIDLYERRLSTLTKTFSKVDEHKLMLNCLAVVWLRSKSVMVDEYVVRCINVYSSNTEKEDANWIAVGFKSELSRKAKKPLITKDSLLVIYDNNRLLSLHGTISKENYNAHAIFSQYDDRILIPKNLISKTDLLISKA